MAIKVREGTVRHNKITYIIGEILSGLSEEEESRLVSLGVAEIIGGVELEENVPKGVEAEVDPYAEKSAKDMIALLDSTEDINFIRSLLDYEQKNKSRKSVISAIEAKLKEAGKEEDMDRDQTDNMRIELNIDDTIVG